MPPNRRTKTIHLCKHSNVSKSTFCVIWMQILNSESQTTLYLDLHSLSASAVQLTICVTVSHENWHNCWKRLRKPHPTSVFEKKTAIATNICTRLINIYQFINILFFFSNKDSIVNCFLQNLYIAYTYKNTLPFLRFSIYTLLSAFVGMAMIKFHFSTWRYALRLFYNVVECESIDFHWSFMYMNDARLSNPLVQYIVSVFYVIVVVCFVSKSKVFVVVFTNFMNISYLL